jgi:hypothetical protein
MISTHKLPVAAFAFVATLSSAFAQAQVVVPRDPPRGATAQELVGALSGLQAQINRKVDSGALSPLARSGSASDLSTGVLAVDRLAAQSITADKLAPGAVTTALGYAPLGASANLSDLQSAATARANLGLAAVATTGSAAELSVRWPGHAPLALDALLKSGHVNVLAFGADPSGAKDSTAALRAAIATGKSVYLPTGLYAVTDMLTLQNGQLLLGDGVTESRLNVPASFNLSAPGVVKLGSGEPGAQIDKIGFEFYQPTARGITRADLIAYPPALLGAGIPRFRIGHVRISRGRTCLDATGNSGGFDVEFLECGGFDYGVKIDGALDFIRIDRLHHWPFGIGGAGTGDGDLYRDQNVVCASINRADGLVINTLQCFKARIERNDTTSGALPIMIGSLMLDDIGARYVHTNGNTSIGSMYSTKGSHPETSLEVKNGWVDIRYLRTNGSESAPQVVVSGGRLNVGSGRFFQTANGYPAFFMSAGRAVLTNIHMDVMTNQARTAPYVHATGGSLVMTNTIWSAVGAGSGPGLTIAMDSGGNVIQGNAFGGWTVALSNGQLGQYDLGKRYAATINHNGATDASTLPTGWTLKRLAVGNYSISHSLGAANLTTGMRVSLSPQGVDAVSAVWDVANSNGNVTRIRTFSAGVAADVPVSVMIERLR